MPKKLAIVDLAIHPHAGSGDHSGGKHGFSHRKFKDRSRQRCVNPPLLHANTRCGCMAFWREATVFIQCSRLLELCTSAAHFLSATRPRRPVVVLGAHSSIHHRKVSRFLPVSTLGPPRPPGTAAELSHSVVFSTPTRNLTHHQTPPYFP